MASVKLAGEARRRRDPTRRKCRGSTIIGRGNCQMTGTFRARNHTPSGQNMYVHICACAIKVNAKRCGFILRGRHGELCVVMEIA